MPGEVCSKQISVGLWRLTPEQIRNDLALWKEGEEEPVCVKGRKRKPICCKDDLGRNGAAGWSRLQVSLRKHLTKDG